MSKSNYGKIAAGAVASIGLLHAQAAFAQQCIAPEDLTDAGIYAVPVIAEGFSASCTPYLESDGFFASRGGEFVAPGAGGAPSDQARGLRARERRGRADKARREMPEPARG
mgnify:CR=1 FL=1